MSGENISHKPCNTVDTLIGVQLEFRGDIVFSGGLRINGKVEGDVKAQGGGNSTVVISENAEVHGNVTAPHLIIAGKIKGSVHCSGRIELLPRAEIIGDVHYKLITIPLGAVVHGNLTHADEERREKGVVTKLKPVASHGHTRA
ncbi:MAG: polymer-forming cytoskeletal protein [Acidiferrobacterales bacterium]